MKEVRFRRAPSRKKREGRSALQLGIYRTGKCSGNSTEKSDDGFQLLSILDTLTVVRKKNGRPIKSKFFLLCEILRNPAHLHIKDGQEKTCVCACVCVCARASGAASACVRVFMCLCVAAPSLTLRVTDGS